MTIDPQHGAAPEAEDRRWGLPEDVGLLWKSWDEEVIVFNQASGQTHLLDALSAEVLRELEQRPRTIIDLAALFADRYEGPVKVYTVGALDRPPEATPDTPTFSKEICSGPHVERTGALDTFRILKDHSASSGVRRIRGVLE